MQAGGPDAMRSPQAAAFLPSRSHRLLLEACLSDATTAANSFRTWLEQETDGGFDQASLRLFPLLASRLPELGIETGLGDRMRRELRNAWLRNQLHFDITGQVTEKLEEAGITPLLLKGVALASHYYDHPGQRVASDIDLLVQRDQAERALAIFRENGWTSEEPWPDGPAGYAISKGLTLASPAAHRTHVDLHWRLIRWTNHPAAMADLWRHSEPVSVAGRQAHIPGPADMLLHTCAHGAQWNTIAPVRWVADAVTILRKREIDWDHLLLQSQRLGLTLQLQATLPYLVESFSVDVPAQVLETLAAQKADRRERLIFSFCTLPTEDKTFRVRARIHWQLYRRTLGGSPRHFFEYLRLVNKGRSLREALVWFVQVLRVRASRSRD